jgi:hypothetical protein
MQANRTIPCICAHCGGTFFVAYPYLTRQRKYCDLACYTNTRRLDLVAAYWERTEVHGPNECWLWTGALNAAGYAIFQIKPQPILVHRFAYERFVGPIPEGLQIDHVKARGCRHRHCVNPAHLEPVTPEENQRRALTPWFINASKTHCIRGHEFTPDNIDKNPGGHRYCKQCRREWMRRKRARDKAE